MKSSVWAWSAAGVEAPVPPYTELRAAMASLRPTGRLDRGCNPPMYSLVPASAAHMLVHRRAHSAGHSDAFASGPQQWNAGDEALYP